MNRSVHPLARANVARVSAIIPVFNAARTISDAIESIEAQTFHDLEIIAVDDGSKDGSLDMMARFAPRVTVLRQQNRGPSAARNHGVRESSGQMLAFQDADDRWRPQMIECLVAALDANPRASMAYCDVAVIDSDGRPLMTALASNPSPPTVSDMLERLWPIMPSGVVMRRSALAAAGGWPERLTAFEDVYLWLLMREQGEFVHVNEVLAEWRFAHFPNPLKPAGGQEQAARIFTQMVKQRWDKPAAHLVEARQRAPRSILGYIGLRALEEGNRMAARRAFGRAIRFDRWRVRNYLRYMRTFLHPGAARMLGGGSHQPRG